VPLRGYNTTDGKTGIERRTVMATLTVEEAQSRLAQIIDGLSPGEEVVLTRDDKPVATIRAAPKSEEPTPRQFGTLKGTVLYIAPDFDDIPEGFEEYLP
jgi:antitoxin (DNA-binding transcriptional repressor) of toxin-antitoxin stability system